MSQQLLSRVFLQVMKDLQHTYPNVAAQPIVPGSRPTYAASESLNARSSPSAYPKTLLKIQGLGEFRQNQHCREGECVHGAAARRGSSSARRCRRSDGGGRLRSVPAPFVCAEALRPTLRRGAKTTGACCCEVRLVQQYNQRHSQDKIELPSRSLRPGPGPAL